MKIFVISLKDLQDRRKKIESQMKKLGLNFEFFDAIDGRKGLPKKYEKYINRKNSLSDAEYGCALSHSLLYKKIVAEKIQHSIILEEDFMIDNDFAKLVKENYLQNSNCKGVLLYHLFASVIKLFNKPLFGEYQTHKLAKTPLCTTGYYLTLSMAEKLLNASLPVYNHADWHCDIARFGMNAIVPRIVQHPPIQNSTLEKNRTREKNRFGKFGIFAWLCYQIYKPFSVKISKNLEGK